MSRTTSIERMPELRDFVRRRIAPHAMSAPALMTAAFFVSLALAAMALGVFGAGERGTVLALRITARWCFLLFWAAYAGGALAKLCGARFTALARFAVLSHFVVFSRFAVLAHHGREFGLAFAAALSVHVALVLWLMHVAADQRSPMLFFWAGVLATCALTLFSLRRLRDWLGPRLWRILLEFALQYIALVFAADFIVAPLQASGADKYPLSYLPFVIMLLGGAALRLAAAIRRQPIAGRA